MKHVRALLLSAALLLPLRSADACLWDNDTLKEESLNHKDVADVVRGRILKHSPAFYEQKLAYTLPMLEQPDARPERFDDVAVAYEKLGRIPEAIATIEAKEKRFPGLYTTQANLGTFHAHAGDFPRALEHLRRAIAINPEAHFGREKYQVQAIEYLMRLKEDPTLVQKEEFLGLSIDAREASFVLNEKRKLRSSAPTLPKDVLEGLAGMIRFGSGEKSPHLWFSLGNALAWHGHKHLALRALRRAELNGHPLAAEYADLLMSPVREYNPDNEDLSWQDVAAKFDAEWKQGQAWVAQQQRKEEALLAKGKKKQVFGY
ncbi:tetratricopeptide repeat protein [Pyxidicoccus fallax]|uniref:Tetratricopeptide repeat protein n=1 Tax=Pyxidicoccus fallax TaxID=394095 RepID=A0A848LQ94_9BACT|nr:tetratricopeptide repeat protein [Pyxidicoccus fallax]NMO20068.1 tetratricopeptide repeat protein [Pyxidicoccus fallax]NPC80686.1 tetratricopeptide repeat protein [Pyxidicoccus fallax]